MEAVRADRTERASLLRLALFLGTLGFGGGMALISMARHRIVDKDRWIDDETFLRELAVAQAIPGTIAANFAALIGLRAAGWRGALVGLVLIVLPSAILMGLLAVVYTSARQLGPVATVFAGLGPAVVAITLSVGLQFVRKLRKPWQVLLAITAAGVVMTHWITVFEVVLLTASGALLWVHLRRSPARLLSVSLPLLAWVFVQISLSMFGGGLAMIAAIEHQLVESLHWLTPTEFADGISLSQITPGPVATASAFFGYRIAGLAGAVVASCAIFLPSFALVLAASGFLARHSARPDVSLTLEALSAATLGLILASAYSLARSGGISSQWPQAGLDLAIVVVATLLLLRRINPLWVLAGSVVVHAVVTWFRG